MLYVKAIDVSQQRVLFRVKIKCSWIHQTTMLLAMKGFSSFMNCMALLSLLSHGAYI